MLWLLTSLALAQDGSALDTETQDHLLNVVHTLRTETPADLPPEVSRRRLEALDLL